MKRIERLNKYQDILRTHEPWRNKKIKRKLEEDKDAYSDPEKTAHLFVEDRTDHSYILIRPNLLMGTDVFCSRYKMSTCAFQQTQGVPLEKLLEMHENRGVTIKSSAEKFKPNDLVKDLHESAMLFGNSCL